MEIEKVIKGAAMPTGVCQKLFDIAKTERETKIQPDSMADDCRRKAVAFVVGRSGGCFHEAILA
ncbi:hypothetical protein KSC_111080 [Ktedonobacter sp. SOSP1-52]|nr:hypothetical protein KSC_111080 [Ktedonobacter sp. SOSP1-52]